jgi:hypothetical protein
MPIGLGSFGTGKDGNMRTRPVGAVLTILAVTSAFVAVPVLAQTTGNVVGIVSDAGGIPLPGVSVSIRSAALQGTRTAMTGVDGGFRFPGVPPGDYTVTATLSGTTTVERTSVRVALSETKTVNLIMGSSRGDKLVVAGEVPAVDTKSTTGGTNYDAGTIAKLPLNTYYTDVVRLQPGVQQDNGETQGRSQALSIYGSTSAENLFLIDGVNATSVIKGVQGKAINYTFVQELEVKTDGYQAEFGRNMGGVVNAITRQGGNEFHGGVLGLFGNASMRAERRRDITLPYSQQGDVQASALNPKNTEYLAGATLGGYVLKDRVWIFGAYDKYYGDRTTMPLAGIRAGEEFPQTFDANLYSGKITFQITPSTELNASVFADPETNGGSLVAVPISFSPDSYEGEQKIGGQDYSVRASQVLGSRGLLTLQYGHHVDRFQTIVSDVPRVTDNTARVIYGQLATVYGGFGSVPGTTMNNESTRDGFAGKVSLLLGTHELKVGGDYEKEVTSGEGYISGGQLLTVYPCLNRNTFRCDETKAPIVQTAAGTIPVFYTHLYRTVGGVDPTPAASTLLSTPSRSWSVFVQDEWRITTSLVVNAGLRYDDQKVHKGNGEVAFDLKDQWSPRVGVSWDFLKDGSSRLYGSFGRYYYGLPTDLSLNLFTAGTIGLTTNYSATSLAQDPTAPRRPAIQVTTYDSLLVDSGLRAPYQDDFTLGVEKAIDPTLMVGGRFIYRTLGRMIESRYDLDPDDPATGNRYGAIFNPGGSGPAASGQYLTCNWSENPTDPTAGRCGLPGVPVGPARRIYRGFELMARKRIGESLWAQASYVYSSLRGNYSGAVQTVTGQTNPGFNDDFDNYQFADNAYGKLELDRPHAFRLDATYTAPFGLQAGLGFWVRSGVPYSRIGFFSTDYPGALYLEERGSNGRTPAEWDTSVVLSYDFKVGSLTITPLVYVFSVFNNQIVTGYSTYFNPYGSFVTDPKSPFYGQAGLQPGTASNCPATAPAPCSDNPDYMKATARTSPRVLRVGLKVAF